MKYPTEFETVDIPVNRGEEISEGVKSLYQTILRKPGIRMPELSNTMQVPAKTLERWTKQLRDEKRIVFKGASKTGGYFVCDEDR